MINPPLRTQSSNEQDQERVEEKLQYLLEQKELPRPHPPGKEPGSKAAESMDFFPDETGSYRLEPKLSLYLESLSLCSKLPATTRERTPQRIVLVQSSRTSIQEKNNFDSQCVCRLVSSSF